MQVIFLMNYEYSHNILLIMFDSLQHILCTCHYAVQFRFKMGRSSGLPLNVFLFHLNVTSKIRHFACGFCENFLENDLSKWTVPPQVFSLFEFH